MGWLHARPENELDAWGKQLAQAKWLEERYFKTLARIIHGNKAVR